MDDLRSWLNNPSRDYFQGVALYQKYGVDIRLKMRVFPSGDFLNNRKLLLYELQKTFDQLEEQPLLPGEVAVVPQPAADMQIPEVPAAIVAIPFSVKGYLRKEFPRIDYATLPDELKILLVDRISLYNRAKEAREKKFAATTDEERLHWNSLEIRARIENKLIWDELNHFNEHGVVLGKHPRFKLDATLEQLRKLSREELFMKKHNLPSAISKARKALREDPANTALVAKKELLLQKYKLQEKEINRLLGL